MFSNIFTNLSRPTHSLEKILLRATLAHFIWFVFFFPLFSQTIQFDSVTTLVVFKGERHIYHDLDSIKIGYDEDNVTFYFHFQPRMQQKVTFYYGVNPLNCNQSIDHDNFFRVPNIPEGAHTIYLIAKLDNEEILARNKVNFFVASPIWKEWWFMPSLFLLLLAFLGLGIYFYYRQHTRQERQTYLLREKMHIDLHDEVGSSLSSIRLLTDLLHQKVLKVAPQATEEVAEITREMQQQIDETQEEMRDLMWAINPKNDKAANVLQKTQSACRNLLVPAEILYQVNEEGDLQALALLPDRNYQLIRFIKEALHNIVKHSGADWVDISLGINDRRFYVIIQDNGVGFDLHQQYEGTGLSSLRRRAEALGAELHIESILQEGTTISLSFQVDYQ